MLPIQREWCSSFTNSKCLAMDYWMPAISPGYRENRGTSKIHPVHESGKVQQCEPDEADRVKEASGTLGAHDLDKNSHSETDALRHERLRPLGFMRNRSH